MNITDISDGSLLNQIMVPRRCGNYICTVHMRVSELLPRSLSYDCITLRFTVTVMSDIYNESDPTEKDVMIFKRKFTRLRLLIVILLCQSRTSNIK